MSPFVLTFKILNDKSTHLVLVPRHPERANWIGSFLKKEDVTFSFLFNGEKLILNLENEITIVNEIGHLNYLYSISDLAFIGGTLIEHGGQNFLEAVQFGLPIFSGPNTYNFKEISEDLQSLQILNIIDSIEDLALEWGEFSHDSQIKELSQNYLSSRQGAVQRSVEKLVVLVKD